MLSLAERVVEVLKSMPGQSFTVMELAHTIASRYPEAFVHKRAALPHDEALIQQLRAEIYRGSGQRAQALEPGIKIHKDASPHLYCYHPQRLETLPMKDRLHRGQNSAKKEALSEAQLCEAIVPQLAQQFGLTAQVLQVQQGRHTRKGLNHWLYPDVIAKEEMKGTGTPNEKSFWSCEVKTQLTVATLRSSFFQTLSHSAWAHLSYFIFYDIKELRKGEIYREWRSLHAQHGVGLMQYLNGQLHVLIPARERQQFNALALERLAQVHPQVRDFV